ncbi:MAG: hypothetical protein IPH71_16205 [Proteobacteria bacterium]|nr:hypothetical protein [Pseudomonadota bacterium]
MESGYLVAAPLLDQHLPTCHAAAPGFGALLTDRDSDAVIDAKQDSDLGAWQQQRQYGIADVGTVAIELNATGFTG